MDEIIDGISYIEEIQNVDQNLLSNKDFFEKLLLKFGKSEDFSPDQILDFADETLKQDVTFIINTFLDVITLKYSKRYLYSNHHETISYFYFNHVKPLLISEENAMKLLTGIGASWLLNDADFLSDIKNNYELETGETEDKNENLKTFLIKTIISDTPISSSGFFKNAIDAVGWIVIKYLPLQYRSDESIYAHALKKNIKAKEYIAVDLQENSEAIKSILNDKNSVKDKRAKTKALVELLLSDPEEFSRETRGMKFSIDLKKLKELPDNVAAALGKHHGNVNLSGISELSDLATFHLQTHKGQLNLSNLKHISEKGAENLLKHNGNIALHEYPKWGKIYLHEIGISTAKLIRKCYSWKNFYSEEIVTTEKFYFINAIEISPEVIREFSGNSIWLNSAIKISDELLDELVKTTGQELSLTYEDLSDEIALKISKYQGTSICLLELKNLSVQAARYLSGFKGDKLHFCNPNWLKKIKSIDDYPITDAERKAWINFDKSNPTWLSNLSGEIAKELSQFKGKELIFENLTGITDESILHLCKFSGSVNIKGAYELSQKSIEKILESIESSQKTNKGLKELIISHYTTKKSVYPELLESFTTHIQHQYREPVDLNKLSNSILDRIYIR